MGKIIGYMALGGLVTVGIEIGAALYFGKKLMKQAQQLQEKFDSDVSDWAEEATEEVATATAA